MTLEEGRQIVDHLLECSKPVISAVNGYAMGLGATVALLADVVFAARSATFADTHVSMGIGAGDGGQVIWPLLMGVNRAKYYLMTGDRLDATEAERLGLVNFVVDDGAVVARRSRWRDASPPVRVSRSRRRRWAINSYMRMISNLVLPLSLSMEGRTMSSDDHREAVRAFQEKRTATFTGH